MNLTFATRIVAACAIFLIHANASSVKTTHSNRFKRQAIQADQDQVIDQAPNPLPTKVKFSPLQNETVVFKCAVSGHPTPTINWKKSDSNEYLRHDSEERIEILSSQGILKISSLALSDSGVYSCFAFNSLGVTQIDFTLNIQEPTPTTKEKCEVSPILQESECRDSFSSRRIIHVWTYNKQEKACLRRRLRDCSTLYNKYNSRADCESECMDPCKLPLETGTCTNYVVKLYYNSTSETCQPFVYGGCDGNENNFKDIYTCKSTCSPQPPIVPPVLRHCPFCSRHLPNAYCNSDFVIIGRIKRITPSLPRSRVRRVSIQITRIFKDETNLLGGVNDNPTPFTREIDLDVDETCPCPNVRGMAHPRSGSSDGSLYCSYRDQPNSRSRSRHCKPLILSGHVRFGFLTITQGSLATEATHTNIQRMTANANFPRFCHMISAFNGRR